MKKKFDPLDILCLIVLIISAAMYVLFALAEKGEFTPLPAKIFEYSAIFLIGKKALIDRQK